MSRIDSLLIPAADQETPEFYRVTMYQKSSKLLQQKFRFHKVIILINSPELQILNKRLLSSSGYGVSDKWQSCVPHYIYIYIQIYQSCNEKQLQTNEREPTSDRTTVQVNQRSLICTTIVTNAVSYYYWGINFWQYNYL